MMEMSEEEFNDARAEQDRNDYQANEQEMWHSMTMDKIIELTQAAEALLGASNTLECLGEWAAEDRNHKSQITERAKVDEIKKRLRNAISEVKIMII